MIRKSESTGELQSQIDQLEAQLERLESAPSPLLVPITTFAPEPFRLIVPLTAVVEPTLPDDPGADCEYVANFFEAGIAASGETVEEAIRNLKDRLLAKFDLLERLPVLGKPLQRQQQILKGVIRRCPEEAAIR